MRVLLIDWSVLSYQNMYRMNSPGFDAKTESEKLEFTRLMAEEIYYYQHRFPHDKLIIALDHSVPWRVQYQSEYYMDNHWKWKHNDHDRTYLVNYDSLFMKLYWWEEEWHIKKLKFKEIDWEEWDTLEFHEITETDAQRIVELFPKYKGKRLDKDWPFAMTKAEFKELRNKVALAIGSLCDAQVIEVDKAEADDIIYVVSDRYAADDVLLITVDSDLHQLRYTCITTQIFDPVKHTYIEKTVQESKTELGVKLLSGDTSDNIAPMFLKKKVQNIGKPGARKLIAKHGSGKALHEFLKKESYLPAYQRNLDLIYLPNIPDTIQDTILEKIKTVKPPKGPVNWDVLKLDALERTTLAGKATRELAEDRIWGYI